jgi:SAM-dependent methyltransferase
MMTDRSSAAAYEAVAPYYDLFTAHHDYERWVSGLLRLAYAHGLQGERALDAGCGTGKSFVPLLARGFDVTACDQSRAMLQVAADKAGPSVTLRRGDLRWLDALGEFDLITCLDDVVNYMFEPEDLTAALSSLARNLRLGGVLVFDANTVATYRSFFRETVAMEEPGTVLVWRGKASDRFGPAEVARGSVDVFHETCSGWMRSTSEHEQRHHPEATVRRCITRAGLRCLAVYGQDPDVNFDPALDELRHNKAVYVVTR